MSVGAATAPSPGTREPIRVSRMTRIFETAQSVAVQIAAFALSMAVLIALLWTIGYDPGLIVRSLWKGSLGSDLSVSISLKEAMPLVLTPTAIWIAYQTGLYNIGADGQLQVGGFVALLSTFALPASSPPYLMIPVALLAGAGTGAVWAAAPAALKAYRGANEIISTIMLNYVALIAIRELTQGPFQSASNPYTAQTDNVPANGVIGPVASGTSVTWGILVALAVSIASIALVQGTTMGLRLRSIGLNREAARRSGLPVRAYWLGAFGLSGALSGLAGALVIVGLRFYVAEGWADPWGFEGMIIAFLALRSPYMIPLWGLLFGMLAAAGPVIKGDASVPNSIVTVMQTLPVIVLFLLFGLGRRLRGKPILGRAPVAAEGSSG
jgi:general nucleoside transport system permease protein